MAAVLRRWPRLARFVSEFGAQAVPESADVHGARTGGRTSTGPGSQERHNLQPPALRNGSCPPDEFATFDDWRAATQAYQAALIQLQIEDLRRLRYRPTGGFLQFCFADGHPGVTWSVLDHERRPKAGHAALAAACRSVLPMVDPRTGHVHVANELRTPFPGAEIEVRVGEARWAFGGDLAADSLAYVGSRRHSRRGAAGSTWSCASPTSARSPTATDAQALASGAVKSAQRRAARRRFRNFGPHVVAVHDDDVLQRDPLGAGRLALAVEGAAAEELLHPLHHAPRCGSRARPGPGAAG